MKNIYRLLGAMLVALCCFANVTDAAGITNYANLTNAAYWTKQNPHGDEVILDAKGVSQYNKGIISACKTMPDLLTYPATVNGDSLKTKVMNYSVLDDDLYLRGNKVSDNYKDILRRLTNVSAIPATVNVKYAVTVRRTDVRNLPTSEGLYFFAGDTDFDALQETTLDPGEPVLVLHQSANKFFYFIQASNYCGWVSTFNVALTDKATWQQFANPKDYIVVTDKDYILKTGNEMVYYQQGARIPVESISPTVYTVVGAQRRTDGTLNKQKMFLKKDSLQGLNFGPLPYTSNNILKAAFAFYGQPYGWGGMKKSVDCSSLIYNAYRTVGIYLPRNADEQENCLGIHNVLDGMDAAARKEVLLTLTPGAALHMEGHTMMYIGNIKGEPYAIHALGSYFTGGKRIAAMKVVVSDLSLTRANGEDYLNALTSAVEYK